MGAEESLLHICYRTGLAGPFSLPLSLLPLLLTGSLWSCSSIRETPPVPSTLSGPTQAGTSVPAERSSSEAVRYTVLVSGNKAGIQITSRDPDGSWRYHFEYNDRGRGPD